MRELLAADGALAGTSGTALAVVGVVAVVVLVPMLALCGSCDEREPERGPFDQPGRQQQQQYQQQPMAPHGYQQPGYSHQQQPGYSHQHQHQQGYSHQQQYHGGYPPNSGHYQQQPPQQQQFSHSQQGYGPSGGGSHYHQGSHQQHSSHPQQASHPQHGSHQQHSSQYQQSSHQQPHSRPDSRSVPGMPVSQPGGPPGGQQGVPPSGTHLQPADVTLEAVEAVLFQVCDGMKGMIKPGKTLVRETIRTGVSAVIADVTTNYAVDETMMLFPDKNKKSRQMRLYEQLNLKDSMPLVSVDTEIFSHEENGRKVTLPAAIFVNRVKTLGDTLKGMKTIEEKQAELFGIWSQLAKVLKMFHQRGWYLRDVTYENVVHVRMGATEGWTLLEFGNASRPKSSIAKNTIPARQCPPELAGDMLTASDDKVHLTVAGDMWMLGMLVYQVMTGEPYWKKSLRDEEILQIMADTRRPLPHQEKPVLNLVQLILEQLLHRDPNQRLSSSDLIKRLEQDMATAGAKTINPGPVVDEQPIVLDGT